MPITSQSFREWESQFSSCLARLNQTLVIEQVHLPDGETIKVVAQIDGQRRALTLQIDDTGRAELVAFR